MHIHEAASGDRVATLRDAAVTLAAVVLAFLALDDVTTDRSSSFFVERGALACCAVWFVSLAWRFVRQGRLALGLSSFGMVIAAAAAQPSIGSSTIPSLAPAYLATVFGLACFLLMSGKLVVHAVGSALRDAA